MDSDKPPAHPQEIELEIKDDSNLKELLPFILGAIVKYGKLDSNT